MPGIPSHGNMLTPVAVYAVFCTPVRRAKRAFISRFVIKGAQLLPPDLKRLLQAFRDIVVCLHCKRITKHETKSLKC